MVLPNVPALAIPWHPTLRRQLWAAVAPWFAYGIFACGVTLTRSRHRTATLWAGNKSIQRPGTLDLSDDGLVATDVAVTAHYRWPHLVGYRETAHLLLLHTEDGGLVMIPKRAVPNPADEYLLRAMIQTHIAAGAFLPREVTFPVRPIDHADAVPPG